MVSNQANIFDTIFVFLAINTTYAQTKEQNFIWSLTGADYQRGNTLQSSTVAHTLVSQPEPTACEADSLYASPSGAYLIPQYNCHDNLISQLIPTAVANATTFSRSYFLDWSPDDRWFLLRDVDQLEANQLLLLAADGSAKQF